MDKLIDDDLYNMFYSRVKPELDRAGDIYGNYAIQKLCEVLQEIINQIYDNIPTQNPHIGSTLDEVIKQNEAYEQVSKCYKDFSEALLAAEKETKIHRKSAIEAIHKAIKENAELFKSLKWGVESEPDINLDTTLPTITVTHRLVCEWTALEIDVSNMTEAERIEILNMLGGG
jgi:hypothetical protein